MALIITVIIATIGLVAMIEGAVSLKNSCPWWIEHRYYMRDRKKWARGISLVLMISGGLLMVIPTAVFFLWFKQ